MPIESAEIQAKSYRYLRIAIIALLLALAAAVFYQSSQQGSLLASVSAYYYTPAQAAFVGALIGLGASMIALQGMNAAEDMFLNLGGMFAIVVAIVPTGRGADFKTAVQACKESGGTLLTHRAAMLDCPTVHALVDATKANVENNMAAALIVGGLAIGLAAVFLLRDRTAKRGAQGREWALAGLYTTALVWLGALIALAASVDWLANNAHYIAAGGLFLSILLVAGANAHRHQEKPSVGLIPKANVLKSPQEYPYTWIAIAMLIVAGVLIVLWLTNVISLFWVEILVALLFVIFWIAQTIDIELEVRARAREEDLTNAKLPVTLPTRRVERQ